MDTLLKSSATLTRSQWQIVIDALQLVSGEKNRNLPAIRGQTVPVFPEDDVIQEICYQIAKDWHVSSVPDRSGVEGV